MATSAHRLIRDQNLNILCNDSIPMEKTDTVKPSKKGGGLGGRKALNDISNSRKPSGLQSVKKDNSLNVIAIEKDPVNAKAKSFKAPEKGKSGGRKVLGDLTNSVKPSSKHAPVTGRKLLPVAENVPSAMADERFLHNHQECIKAQAKAVDMDYFLKSVGLSNVQLSPKMANQTSLKKPGCKMRHLEMDEIPEELLFGNDDPQCKKACRSPVCQSPKSPKLPYMNWDEDILPELMMI